MVLFQLHLSKYYVHCSPIINFSEWVKHSLFSILSATCITFKLYIQVEHDYEQQSLIIKASQLPLEAIIADYILTCMNASTT